MLKTVELTEDFRTPYISPTHHNEQHSVCPGVIHVPKRYILTGPEVAYETYIDFIVKNLAEDVRSPMTKEVPPVTEASE